MIRVIAFDFADVIIEGPISSWLLRNGISKAGPIWDEYKIKAHEWDTGKMTNENVYQYLSQVTGISKNLIWEEVYLSAKLNHKLIKLIKKLKCDYKIIIFSNYISDQLNNLLRHHKIDKLFDEVIISSDYGLKKPDPEFYQILVDKSGVKKNEILFTDDKLRNVVAANEYGIKSFVFSTFDNFVTDLKLAGVEYG